MPKKNSLPTWAHTDLDTLITLLSDSAEKMREVRNTRALPKAALETLEGAFDDIRLAHRYALAMREHQEDIVEVGQDGTEETPGE